MYLRRYMTSIVHWEMHCDWRLKRLYAGMAEREAGEASLFDDWTIYDWTIKKMERGKASPQEGGGDGGTMICQARRQNTLNSEL